MTDRQTLLPRVPEPVPSPTPGPWVTGPADPSSAATGRAVAAPRHSRHRAPSPLQAVGVVLTGMGLLLAMFFTYLYVFTPLTHARDQHRLLQSLVGNPRAVYKLVAGHLPAQGAPVGILTIPALHEREVVVMGTSAADLQEGPGLMAGTGLPGDPGNAVIAGRRVTYGGPFASLGTLVPGQRVQVVDGAGTSVFRVTRVTTVAGRPDVVSHRGQRWLTLVTSGSPLAATGHVVVVARAAPLPGATATPAGARRQDTLLGLDGDPAAGILAALWGVVFVIGLGATVYAVRRWRQVWLSYVLSVPILLACGLFACESLARCLPATL